MKVDLEWHLQKRHYKKSTLTKNEKKSEIYTITTKLL